MVSPALNNMGPDEPLGIGIQIDNQTPQAMYYIPAAAPGDLPSTWDGNDGYIANAIINVHTNWTIGPGEHTLKVRIRLFSLPSLTCSFLVAVDD